jgi:membrane protein DedA with SNARE-associated domain
MPWRQFFFWNALGGISWGVTYGLVGYFAGSAAAAAISRFGIYAFVVLGATFVAYAYVKLRGRGSPEGDRGSSEGDE